MIHPQDADALEIVESLLAAGASGTGHVPPRNRAGREILRALREHRDEDVQKAVAEVSLGMRACYDCAAHYAAGGPGCCPACSASLDAEGDQ